MSMVTPLVCKNAKGSLQIEGLTKALYAFDPVCL